MKQQDKPLAQELLKLLLRSAKRDTIRSIYERIAPYADGAVHCAQNPAGTETSRFSHADTFVFEGGSTNLANLPKKQALLDPLFNVRECLVPRPGSVLGKADYSQAEARWCAWIAEDPIRMRLYEQEIDHYKWFVAMLKWEDEGRWQEVTKEERNAIGKVGVLSGQYGVSWRTLMDNVNADYGVLHNVSINAKTAKAMQDVWPNLLKRTVEWWKEVEEAALGRGYLVNSFGMRRDFFGRTDSQSARQSVVREAIAFGPQSSNACMLNMALRRLYEVHDPQLLRLLLQVHDEIVFECSPRDVRHVACVVKETMEFPVEVHGRTLIVPAEVSMSSRNWSEGRKVA